MIKNNSTLRKTAKEFNISKSTVHKDIQSKLKETNYSLWVVVNELLEKNKKERHLRGGEATKRKYELLKNQ